jgi:hypothetical protein
VFRKAPQKRRFFVRGRLARRDDALTAALVGYGLVAFLVVLAYCINEALLGGKGKGKLRQRLCERKQKKTASSPGGEEEDLGL